MGNIEQLQNRAIRSNGFGAVLSAMLITMFSFMGAEIVTIAAAESDTPEKHIVRATTVKNAAPVESNTATYGVLLRLILPITAGASPRRLKE